MRKNGDVISIITHWGESYGSYTYDAWGNVISQSGSIASLNPIRYRGYYYDAETGLYYLGSRYYDPAVKRFVNSDGFASTGQGFIGCNMFVYCNNSPVSNSDSQGMILETVGAAILGGALAGAVVSAASSVFNAAVNGDSVSLKTVGAAALHIKFL